MASTLAGTKVVGPGDCVTKLPETGIIRLSPALTTSQGDVVSLKAGTLKQTRTGQLFVEGRQQRYTPAEGDVVVGVIADKVGENFTVDIRGAFCALLPQLSFEGATRRNRPNLVPGDVVYARVVAASRDQDPVLSCVDATGRASGYGQLKDGITFNCSSAYCRQLLQSPPAPVLEALGKVWQFEIAVGLNGRAWLSSANTATTILISNAIQQSEFMTKPQVQTLVSRLASQLQ